MRRATLFIATVGVIMWGVAAAAAAAPPRLLRSDVSADFVAGPTSILVGCCGQAVVTGTGESAAALRAGQLGGIRWTLAASADSSAEGLLWNDGCVPDCRSGALRSVRVFIRAYRSAGGRYTRLLLMYRSGGRRIFDRLSLARVPGLPKPTYQWTRGRLPVATTAPASLITQDSATVSATVHSPSPSTVYSFQYGTTATYGSTTASQAAGAGPLYISATTGALNLGGVVSAAGGAGSDTPVANQLGGTGGAGGPITVIAQTIDLLASLSSQGGAGGGYGDYQGAGGPGGSITAYTNYPIFNNLHWVSADG